jgi:hypothetical protein
MEKHLKVPFIGTIGTLGAFYWHSIGTLALPPIEGGSRIGAVLSWSQIDLERDEIRLTTRKTSKPLLIPIALPLREHLLVSVGLREARDRKGRALVGQESAQGWT